MTMRAPGGGRPVPRPRGDEDALYREHASHLRRAVARNATTSAQTIEDACSYAWQRLLEVQPERTPHIFGWLRTVATHEAWRLMRRDRRGEPQSLDHALQITTGGAEPHADGSLHDVVADPRLDPERTVEAREALRAVARLPERKRTILGLQVAGMKYAEITAITGEDTKGIDRQLRRARLRLAGLPRPASDRGRKR